MNFSSAETPFLTLVKEKARYLQGTGGVEVLECDSDTLGHGLLALTDPDTGVKVLLVGLVLAVGVADSGADVVLLVDHVVTDTRGVSELHVCVHVDLDNTVADSVKVLLLGGAGATMEDEEYGLLLVDALLTLLGQLLGNIDLVLAQELGVQTHITRLVDTVNVAKTSGNREIRRDGGEGVVDVPDILRLSVERVVVNVLVVDTILLSTSDTNFLGDNG